MSEPPTNRNERRFWLFNPLPQAVSFGIEPWGAEILLLPHTEYALVTDADDARLIELLYSDGRREQFPLDGKTGLKGDVRTWPPVGTSVRLLRDGDRLVWDTDSPSQVLASLMHWAVDKALWFLQGQEGRGKKVSGRDLVEFFGGVDGALPRDDYPYLLEEHGLIENDNDVIRLTPLGRQFMGQPV